MANSDEELQRWNEFRKELACRMMFTPSCLFYFIHMANNKVFKKLNTAATTLAKAFKYAKYYYLDLDDPGPKPRLYSNTGYDHEKIIALIKDTSQTSQRFPMSKEESVKKIMGYISTYNQEISELKKITFGFQPSFIYPENYFIAVKYNASSSMRRSRTTESLAQALKCRAALERKVAALKGQGATFSISDKTVSCFLKGDAISPKLLGIEVGDVVNDDYDFRVSSLGVSSFTVDSSGLSSITSIISPLCEVEITAANFKSFVFKHKPISEDPILNSGELKDRFQSMLDRIRDIDPAHTPSIYSNLDLTLAEGLAVLPSMRPRVPPFTKQQRDFAIKTLDLAKNRGFDLVEFMLRNYRIRDCLFAESEERSLDALAVDMGSAMSTFVSDTKRSL